MALDPALTSEASHLAGALLVAALVGAQREATPGDHPGLRDFLLIGLAGGLCGLLGNEWLAAAAALGIAAMLSVFHFEEREKRTGITTELAGLATFVLALLASSDRVKYGEPIAIAIAILIALFLEAKQRLQHLLRETITEQEFNATLAFVTTVLVIYPLLPAGRFGPFMFFSPQQVWMFVILISSISYVGYFLEKFLGEEKGLVYTAMLGGLASTTAVTAHLARLSRVRPEQSHGLMRGFLIANTVQFPRTFLIVAVVSPEFARACAAPLGLMMLAGIAMAEVAEKLAHHKPPSPVTGVKHENPFRIVPALKFGAMFTVVVFFSKAASAQAGSGAFLGTSLLGGLVDVATVIAPASDLLKAGTLQIQPAVVAVLLALAANAVLKIAVAAVTGTWAFALRITLAFTMWAGIGALGFWLWFR